MLMRLRNLQFMVCMVLAAACWGFAIDMSKGVLAYFPPLTLLVVQLTASIVFLWIPLAVKRARIPLDMHTVRSAAIGLLSPGIADTLSLIGLTMTTASMSTLIWDFQPIVILALAFLILKERISRPLGAFSLLATLGVVLVAGVGLNAQGNNILTGNLLTLIGVGVCSTYIVLTRRISTTINALTLVALQQTVSWVFVLAIWPTELMRIPAQNLFTLSPTIWGWAILSGIVYYALGFWLYITGLRKTPASLAGFFINLLPVFGVTGAYIFLGERLATFQWLGAILILVSVGNIFRLQRADTALATAYT
jgi:drug/metabolite transporter (DMT)-like permease